MFGRNSTGTDAARRRGGPHPDDYDTDGNDEPVSPQSALVARATMQKSPSTDEKQSKTPKDLRSPPPKKKNNKSPSPFGSDWKLEF